MIAKTSYNAFGIGESIDVGEDMNTPVYTGYHRKKFIGKIQKIVVETFPGKLLIPFLKQAIIVQQIII